MQQICTEKAKWANDQATVNCCFCGTVHTWLRQGRWARVC
jgi:hypothetical protein